MPDHVHLLLEGLGPACNLVQFVKILKQKSGFTYSKNTGERLWQRFFYDHILRPADHPDAVAWYIWLNPVRAGLCAAPQDYRFSGSLTLDYRERIAPRVVDSAVENGHLKVAATLHAQSRTCANGMAGCSVAK